MSEISELRIREAFQTATMLTFSRMLMLEITPAQDADSAEYDLSGIIGFVGGLTGNIALRLTSETARGAFEKLTGEPAATEADVIDGVGELINIIAGNAKANFAELAISISLPEVVSGKGHQLNPRGAINRLDLYFASAIGNFMLSISYGAPQEPAQ